jgi:ribonucleotide monophosphatase NagD (HAD superfamily)
MRVRGLLLDLDGTLYVGSEAVPGAREAVARLKEAGLGLRYVTNTTRTPRRAVVERLRWLGFAVTEREVFTPARAAARVIRDESCLALVEDSLLETWRGSRSPKSPLASCSSGTLVRGSLTGGSTGRSGV